jgi:hypothetical protein
MNHPASTETGEETGDKPESALRNGQSLSPGGKSTHLWGRSVCGVGGSLACLEARVGREEPQAFNGSLCEHYKGSVRVPQFWIAVAHGKKNSQLI